MDIHVTGFRIADPGDISVGIFDQSWHLKGDFWFEDEQHLQQFKDSLVETFWLYAENPYVQTYEELQEEIDRENEQFE